MKNTNLLWNDLKENPQKNVNNSDNKSQLFLTILLAILTTAIQYLLFYVFTSEDSIKINRNKYAVAVAKKNISKGHIVGDDNIKFVYLDLGENKDHFILSSEFESIRGKTILTYVNENTPLVKNLFHSISQTATLPEKIPFGKRLFVLEVEQNSLLEHLQIGDRIDIIAHIQIPQFGKVTETILDGIEIVGIGTQTSRQGKRNSSKSLSLYISPDEVKIISFMKQYSFFSVSLRNPNDYSSKKSSAMTFNKFIEDPIIKKIIKDDSFQIIQGKSIK
ncbi:Flp pilus assembly protein CpaB [Fluviispira multicolorata]|uniref:SAF domain-containing protein n=1 Tax=Fluviispira multicolorata TaxID=2654512 RepID=A0A833JEI0_9BACT|nr:SAF domain-containing protein [Fluviispira multicolorata]KAB8033216.1 hypothetical protein GCL57_00530 [Fluviispira multicolorata]